VYRRTSCETSARIWSVDDVRRKNTRSRDPDSGWIRSVAGANLVFVLQKSFKDEVLRELLDLAAFFALAYPRKRVGRVL
jgi:hypothetical protein|tara:strand:+ start:10207 stop:10443 length:237 start_codon:yes stop_codon:yes gene_type:complete